MLLVGADKMKGVPAAGDHRSLAGGGGLRRSVRHNGEKRISEANWEKKMSRRKLSSP
jgi:hypothetical protein